ncbi:MAG: CotH kinase family protein [Lachnospiraceae bacterium]|nr:CotH kinase family protein [Lachnospiraceae bacterium]
MLNKCKGILAAVLMIAFLPSYAASAAERVNSVSVTDKGILKIIPQTDTKVGITDDQGNKKDSNTKSTTKNEDTTKDEKKEETGKKTTPETSVIYSASQIKKQLKKLESSTTIPTVCVYTDGGAEVISREDYVGCEVYTVNCDKEYKLKAERAGIRVRGNSTAYGGNVAMIRANQVPYKIKFETKTNMFGLNDDAECKKWVLVKAESNLLKNDIAFSLGRTILHDYNYCSDGILVHMYLNGKFKGIYELCEQSQINKHRINIYETPEGYKGVRTGYLVEIDNYGEAPCFRMNYENATFTDIEGRTKKFKSVIYSIKSDVYSDKQKQFIKNYVTNVFKIVYEACVNKKYYVFDEDYNLVKAGKKFLKQADENGEPLDPAYIVSNNALNLESVVDLYLVYEIAKDRDVGEGSFFMYADLSKESRDERLTFTCPWDFEWGFDSSYKALNAAVFNTDEWAAVYEERSNPWFILLMKQDWFMDMVKNRWKELRTVPEGKKTDAISAVMKQEKKILETYKEDLCKNGKNAVNLANSLINWVNNRIKFLDGWLLND